MATQFRPAAVPATLDNLVTLTRAWMLCSYGSVSGKHEVKRLFNHALRAFALELKMEDTPVRPRRPLAERPVSLVVGYAAGGGAGVAARRARRRVAGHDQLGLD